MQLVWKIWPHIVEEMSQFGVNLSRHVEQAIFMVEYSLKAHHFTKIVSIENRLLMEFQVNYTKLVRPLPLNECVQRKL